MMLYVIRHGIAFPREDADCPPDPERPLTKKGALRMGQVARGLLRVIDAPEVYLTSPYLRAVQTAELFAKVFGYPFSQIVRSEALAPGASPKLLFAELEVLKAESVVCFGHAPHLDEAIALAIGARRTATELKKAGVAAVQLERFKPPLGALLWLQTPNFLRMLAR